MLEAGVEVPKVLTTTVDDSGDEPADSLNV